MAEGVQLFSPERHVALASVEWDPARVEAWLRRWAADALATRQGVVWPLHPRDASDAPGESAPEKNLYLGALGVWLALGRLARERYCGLPGELAEVYIKLLAAYDARPDLGERAPSWFLGESALLTACALARRDGEIEERLARVIAGNRDNPTLEMLWGAPGTMTAALLMYEATGEGRWGALFRDSAAALWDEWKYDEMSGVWLWEQDLYGNKIKYVGAGHGWAGNLHPLWRGWELLGEQQRAQLRERTLQGLERLGYVEGELVNWPAVAGAPQAHLVQWCHGAPGVITSLRHAGAPEALPMLERAGRMVLHAGPLAKGASLCHGTAGNGAALLELYGRTGDAAWLARARQFAMVAASQSEAEAARHGRWWHSLWTGDAGLAWFLADCLAGEGRGLPGLDVMMM